MSTNPSRRVNVSEMGGEERRSVERLLGSPLEEGQQVYILAFTPGVIPDEADRQRALAGMQETFAAAEKHAAQHGASDGEIDELVDEAMNHVRYGNP